METGSVKKIRTEPLAYTTLHDPRILVAFCFYNLMGELRSFCGKINYLGFKFLPFSCPLFLSCKHSHMETLFSPLGCNVLMQSVWHVLGSVSVGTFRFLSLPQGPSSKDGASHLQS